MGRIAITLGAPVLVPSGAQQHGRPVDLDIGERGGIDRPAAVDNNSGKQYTAAP